VSASMQVTRLLDAPMHLSEGIGRACVASRLIFATRNSHDPVDLRRQCATRRCLRREEERSRTKTTGGYAMKHECCHAGGQVK
jgi:hypothetical protein